MQNSANVKADLYRSELQHYFTLNVPSLKSENRGFREMIERIVNSTSGSELTQYLSQNNLSTESFKNIDSRDSSQIKSVDETLVFL
ncbi:MAG: hypothetical protein H7326_08570, partial [Bdellovibrionaceae bacterium]|nr:hypothetical protein [Pseudobdellovibrionaceae bacterium]